MGTPRHGQMSVVSEGIQFRRNFSCAETLTVVTERSRLCVPNRQRLQEAAPVIGQRYRRLSVCWVCDRPRRRSRDRLSIDVELEGVSEDAGVCYHAIWHERQNTVAREKIKKQSKSKKMVWPFFFQINEIVRCNVIYAARLDRGLPCIAVMNIRIVFAKGMYLDA